MIGIFIIKLLRISGASSIIAIDIDEKHLNKAEKAGADFTFLTAEENLAERIKQITGGRGADITFEAVGKNESVNKAIELVRKGGTVTLVGNTAPMVDFPLQKAVTGELKILGSCAICGEYEAVLDYLKMGKIYVDDQISAVAPLSEGAKWFERLYKKEDDLGKVILRP
jgi:L-iditol 2-dehydrogenase